MELIEVILSKENLNRAYKKVVANKGASGVDGVTVEELGDYIRENREKISFLCLFKKDWQKQSYLALGGVREKALLRFLSDRPNIKTVFLCLDSDEAGNDACRRLAELVPEGLTVHRLIPLFKDWNEILQHRAEITDGKYLREAIYGLKEPPQEETVEIIRMSEVDTQTVEWLWEPYIPFGKVTIVIHLWL